MRFERSFWVDLRVKKEFLWKISTQKVPKKGWMGAQMLLELKFGRESYFRRLARDLFLKNAEKKTDFTFTSIPLYSLTQKSKFEKFLSQKFIENHQGFIHNTKQFNQTEKNTPIKDDPIPLRHLIISSLFENQLKANLINFSNQIQTSCIQ